MRCSSRFSARQNFWDYDARLAESFQSTFGALVTKFAELAAPEHTRLTDQLAKAVDDRNDLAHHYFWDRVAQFCSSEGRAQMITELNWMMFRFEYLDQELAGLTREYTKRKGISAEALESSTADHLKELLAGLMEPHNPQRVPNPVEIVAAYEWRVVGKWIYVACSTGRN